MSSSLRPLVPARDVLAQPARSTGSSVGSTWPRSIRRSMRYLLMCATETNTKQGIDRLVDALPR